MAITLKRSRRYVRPKLVTIEFPNHCSPGRFFSLMLGVAFTYSQKAQLLIGRNLMISKGGGRVCCTDLEGPNA